MPRELSSSSKQDDRRCPDWTVLSDRIEQGLDEHKVPGLSIAVIRENCDISCRGFGVRKADSGEVITPDTVFEAASLSKPVLAYAAMQLVQLSQLNLDVSLDTYLPEPYLEQEPSTPPIAARHVLSHTSGLPNWRKKGEPLEQRHPAGTRFSYSGEGYVYLQKVVERICGAPIEEVLQSLVFNPLGMQASSFFWPFAGREDWAAPHDAAGTPQEKESWERVNCAAGLHCTASDYAKLMTAFIHSPADAEPVGDLATLDESLTPQTQVNDQPSWHPDWPSNAWQPDAAVGWGLGWGLGTTLGQRSFWHWGDNGGFRAFAIGWPSSGEGMAILTNNVNGQFLIDQLLRDLWHGAWPELDWLNSIYGL